MKNLTTFGITIGVEPYYQPEFSNPIEEKFLFSYRITIENNSDQTVQLLRRHWFILNAYGGIQEVEGEGVIGKQPVLHPGQSHQYSSWAPINSEIGLMYGHFLMVQKPLGKTFKAQIPQFNLVAPFKLN